MGPNFRISRSFYGLLKLPATPDFSQPTLVADGNDDGAYETPYDAAVKRRIYEAQDDSVIHPDSSILPQRADSVQRSDVTPPPPPPHSPKHGVKFGNLDYLNDDTNSVLRHDLNSHIDDDEHTPLPSPTKKNANSLYYQKHRRNQSSVSLLKTYSNVPDYQIGEYKQSSPLRLKPAYHVKIVVVGDGGCGKTCLLVCYSQGEFPTVYVPTIFENYVAHVKTPENETVELALWDTAGQEEYDRLRPLSYPDADIFLICYSMDSPVSLTNVKQNWFPEVNHFCPGVPVILVGLKSDLYNDDSVAVKIDRRVTKSVAREIGAVAHIECSAKTMFNVKTVFNLALDTALKRFRLKSEKDKRGSVMSKLKKNHRFSASLAVPKSHDPPTYEYSEETLDNQLEPAVQTKTSQTSKKSTKNKKHRCIVL